MVEKYLERDGEQFIPNDVLLRCNFQSRSCQVITGPNMGGKSSYVRMIALICLLGQIGAHVPADSAKLCIFDHIFTRMGAGDDLAAGHSTFMSELHRTNFILQRATSRSLVLLDELGRGTAANDGLAIAQATLNYFTNTIGCAMLFVTHFPQIADAVEEEEEEFAAQGAGAVVAAVAQVGTHKTKVNMHMSYIEEVVTYTEGNQGKDGNSSSSLQEDVQVMFLYKAVSLF